MAVWYNHRAGVDAGFAALFPFGHGCPGTTQHGRSPSPHHEH